MMPNKTLFGLCPTMDSIFKATRLCKSYFSIAKAIINPPRNKKIILSEYCWATIFASPIPKSGINKKGINAATAKCTASVNHQIDIHNVMPAMYDVCGFLSSNEIKNTNKMQVSGPAKSAIILELLSELNFVFLLSNKYIKLCFASSPSLQSLFQYLPLK